MGDIIELDTATAISPSNAPDPFDGPWSCRLPVELMDMLSRILVEKGDLSTLGALQGTDSKLYEIATPHLYRKLVFYDCRGPETLLGQFDKVPHFERETFLRPLPTSRCHPLRMSLAFRLRYSLGHTTHIFFAYDFGDVLSPVTTLRRLAAFHDIHVTMRTLDPIATLWPSLLEVEVEYPYLWQGDDDRDLAAVVKLHGMLFSPDPRPRNVLRLIMSNASAMETDDCHLLHLANGADLFTSITAERIVIDSPGSCTFSSRPNCQYLEVRFHTLVTLYRGDDYRSYAKHRKEIIRKLLKILVRDDEDGKVSTPYIHTLKITTVDFNAHPDSRTWSYVDYVDSEEEKDRIDHLKTLVDEHWKRHWKPAGLPLKYCILADDEPDDDLVPWNICGEDDDSEDENGED